MNIITKISMILVSCLMVFLVAGCGSTRYQSQYQVSQAVVSTSPGYNSNIYLYNRYHYRGAVHYRPGFNSWGYYQPGYYSYSRYYYYPR